MIKSGEHIQLSASDLVGHLNCDHLTALDRSVAEGVLKKPHVWDPLLEILQKRGEIHEKSYIEYLKAQGFDATEIDGAGVTKALAEQTTGAMKAGAPIIIQGAFLHDNWGGRADILRRIETPSSLGAWSYEVIDTKLARETKGGAILQLCLYSDLLSQAQGSAPVNMHIVAPWSDFQPQSYRLADYAAYYRRVKAGLERSIKDAAQKDTYPEPKNHCDICRWRLQCDLRRRDDDHLCLVAGISKVQISELKKQNITTVQRLAELPTPISWKPERGAIHSFERIREQARIQVEARDAAENRYELLPVEPGYGLARLPLPSDGDIFLDLEGDPHVGEHGLEYLFGYQFKNGCVIQYVGDWAFSREDEKRIFERFVDFVIERLKKYPDLHIYHYAPYEPAALKRIMGRYATREEEVDQMLRGQLFVDLYNVVKNSVRASVESYSIKKLEPFYGFKRNTSLPDANKALAALQASLEMNDIAAITKDGKATVESYNHDDCASTAHLRDWLEGLRVDLVAKGEVINRPESNDGAPNEGISDWLKRINVLIEGLTCDVPIDLEERTPEQHARWILANILDWHRREAKAAWWEYFRLRSLSAEELIDERAAISGLTFTGVDGSPGGTPIHYYTFPPQDTDLRGDEVLHGVGGDSIGTVVSISQESRTIEIKKTRKTANIHPEAVYAHKVFDAKEQANSLVRIGEHVVKNGISGDGAYQAARDLLLRALPRTGGHVIKHANETTLEAATRIVNNLEAGVFPVQGPPGTGKTFTGARMICQLVQAGKKVGITANSHKVIRNLLNGVINAADELGVNVQCVQKPKEMEENQHRLIFAKSNEDLFSAIATRCQVAGGTHFLWSRAEAFEKLDVLFVDEAAQMSLANVLAVAPSAKIIILLGDPQQLDQPTQGSHPDGTEASALDYILNGHQTIAHEQGLFLEETWRLHPEICAFTSELFYEGKLKSRDGLECQIIKSNGQFAGAGLRYVAVEHSGNQNASPEEADAVHGIITEILGSNTRWVDREGVERPVTLDDIIVITPYNAQVFEIQQRLPEAHVGTVDKFQGQENPIAIYSMATSSYADAPRGMEFLYSLNRFNVATSRAKCISILVSSPKIFEAECKTPRQMQLANAFCRYLEMASQCSAAKIKKAA